jgi:2,4-dienoyl-CoA reductase (NADPH2)
MVSMARPFLADAGFVAKARAGRAQLIAPCIACNQACLDHTFELKVATCLVNPRAAHETELRVEPAADAKARGGGRRRSGRPRRSADGGRARAFRHALRGCRRRSAGRCGWQCAIPGKEEFAGLVAYYEAAVAAAGIDLRLEPGGHPGGHSPDTTRS